MGLGRKIRTSFGGAHASFVAFEAFTARAACGPLPARGIRDETAGENGGEERDDDAGMALRHADSIGARTDAFPRSARGGRGRGAFVYLPLSFGKGGGGGKMGRVAAISFRGGRGGGGEGGGGPELRPPTPPLAI